MVELFLALAFASSFAFLFVILSWLISDEPWDELPWKDEPVDYYTADASQASNSDASHQGGESKQ